MRTLLPLLLAPVLAQDYLPLQPGNQWVYRSVAGPIRDVFTMEVGASQVFDGQEYFEVRNHFGRNVWMRQSPEGVLYAYDPATKQEAVLADFSKKEGERYASAIDPCSPVAVVESRNARARVVTGDCEGALKIAYPPARCADAGLVGEIYYPYVGLVERTATTIAGPRTYTLIYSRTGDVTVLSAADASFTLTLDSHVYKGPNPLITARMTLRNSTGQPLEITFPSGQTFDLVFRDEKGDVVYRWSDGKAFTLALRLLSFTGEKNWAVLVPEPGKSLTLRPGKYVAEGWLTTMGQKSWSGTAPFEVQ